MKKMCFLQTFHKKLVLTPTFWLPNAFFAFGPPNKVSGHDFVSE